MLVGNKEGEAAMEITLMGPTLNIEKNCLIAITGGNLSPTIDSQAVPMWKPVYVKKALFFDSRDVKQVVGLICL